MGHTLARKYEGLGIDRKITPACSCGWVGIGYEAHNDWQHTNVADQEREHLEKATR